VVKHERELQLSSFFPFDRSFRASLVCSENRTYDIRGQSNQFIQPQNNYRKKIYREREKKLMASSPRETNRLIIFGSFILQYWSNRSGGSFNYSGWDMRATVARHIFQACPVWIYTQSNITSILFTWVHYTKTANSHRHSYQYHFWCQTSHFPGFSFTNFDVFSRSLGIAKTLRIF
jgi:hypothetical protein